jgi:type VI secretion system protein ImpC
MQPQANFAKRELFAEPASAPGVYELLRRSVGPALKSDEPSPSPASADFTELSEEEALRRLFGNDLNISCRDAHRTLDALLARIDAALSQQVNQILHHPRFQALESSWRGLAYLLEQTGQEQARLYEAGEESEIQVRVLSVSKHELQSDLLDVVEFDQSELFRRVYRDEFSMAGGEPYGLLVGDYEFSQHPEDRMLLEAIGSVAAAAFAPFIAAASPKVFQLDDYTRLDQRSNLSTVFDGPDGIKWESLRQSGDMRFTALVLPRVLMREPYSLAPQRGDGFRFQETARRPADYLWGNAAYAFATVCLKAFAETGWFADIRGFERGSEYSGVVTGLAQHSFATDRRGIALKQSVETAISPAQDAEFARLGLIPLCACPGTEYAAFFSNATLHRPREFNDAAGNANAQMSSMLQYVLCASRFAHYLKVIGRKRLGSSKVGDLEDELNRWLNQYVVPDDHAKPEARLKHPLREGRVTVVPVPGKPGAFQLEMLLRPHYQLDAFHTTLRLVHRLVEGTGAAAVG